MLDVTKQTMLGHDATMAKSIRSQAIAQCQQRNLSKQARECIMAAKDASTLVACYRNEPGAPPPAPGMKPLPKPGGGSGSGTGSGSDSGSGSGTPTP